MVSFDGFFELSEVDLFSCFFSSLDFFPKQKFIAVGAGDRDEDS